MRGRPKPAVPSWPSRSGPKVSRPASAWPWILLVGLLPLSAPLSAEPDPASLPLKTVYRLPQGVESDLWLLEGFLTTEQLAERQAQALFQAIASRTPPPGLIPIYLVEWKNHSELRRRPRPGRENTTEPLFYALPPEAETAPVGHITGRWECEAIHEDGSQNFFAWDLTLEGTNIAARFDPDTEYRFAYITGGSFQNNRFILQVEYSNSRYHLMGNWQDHTLQGTWRHIDETGGGTWNAVHDRSLPPPPAADPAVPLYEWRRGKDQAPRYTTDARMDEPGWTRSPAPLCRVWPLK